MILLLGGTSEAIPIAQALLAEGASVLLSTATDISPRGELPQGLERRTGMLNTEEMEALIRSRNVCALVDATHPFASQASENACRACRKAGIPYLSYERPPSLIPSPGIHWAANHEQGARLSFVFGQPVLLTIGTRNLAPYVAQARKQKIPLTARVLDHPDSMEACRQAGLAGKEVVRATGPFSVEENLALIEGRHIGVLVTKESGEAGGVGTKIEAARNAGCQVVAIRRPPRPQPGYASLPALLEAIRPSIKKALRENT